MSVSDISFSATAADRKTHLRPYTVQLVALIVSSCSQVGVKKALEALVPDLCAPDQHALLTCPVSAVTYEASIIW